MSFHSIAAVFLSAGIICTAQAAELPPAVAGAFDTYTALPGKLVPVLQKVRDQASADANAAELQKLLPEIYSAREQLHRMPGLTPAQNELVRRTYGHNMRVQWARMYEQIARLRDARCYRSVPFAQAFRLMCMMIEK